MPGRLLTYFSKTGTAFLHPGEKTATALLLRKLQPQEAEHILELGFGTGATLVQLHAMQSKALIYGLEKNASMLAMANKRLRCCGLGKKITLFAVDHTNVIPFEAASMDSVYAESVLALSEGDSLRSMLQQIHTILKPGGKLCMNELLWMQHVSKQHMEEMNAQIQEIFGMPQANTTCSDITAWKDLLRDCGFELLETMNLDTVTANAYHLPFSWKAFISDCFTLFYKARGVLHSTLRKERKQYRKEMRAIHREKILEPWLICAIKK
ncbi:MAG: class I SAM-dependent methyltransferase [Chitinophagales bacterium]